MISLVSFLPIVIGIFGIFVFNRMIIERKYMLRTIIMNLIFGGFLYIFLNYLKFELPFNAITGICISFLGMPGVVLLFIIQCMFRIF